MNHLAQDIFLRKVFFLHMRYVSSMGHGTQCRTTRDQSLDAELSISVLL